jgi:hypothetical protein
MTTKDCYRRTRQFVAEFLPRMAITYSVVNLDELDTKGICDKILEEKPNIFFSGQHLRCWPFGVFYPCLPC